MRLCGIETEYGLAIEGRTPRTQLEDAAELVKRCTVEAFDSWDYGLETPRADMRGFQAEALSTDPEDARWDEGTPSRSERELRADRILVNGARFYNDHGHPEYATPECNRLLDLVAHDAAGELVVQRAAAKLAESTGTRVSVYKNNTDFHGASYGTHENYRVERSVGFQALINGLLPFLVCRQLLFGAGKVGSEVGRAAKFQISQRADFLSEVASVDTLYRRPIFNTRDEPHDNASKWVRLHVICGDANVMQWSTAMKVGLTSLAIDLVRDGEAPQLQLCAPVKAFEGISKDECNEWRLELANGSWTTATDVLDSIVGACEKNYSGRDVETDWVINEARRAVQDLGGGTYALRDRVDWVAKRWLLEQFADAEGKWDPETMKSLDLQYHLLGADSLFGAYRESEGVVEVVSQTRVEDSVTTPPPTRALFRSQAVSHPDRLVALGWRRAIYDNSGSQSVQIWDSEDNEVRS